MRIRRIGSGISVFLVSVSLVLFLLRIFGYPLLTVQSASMEPAIPTGSLILEDCHCPYETLREGDVIVYRKGKSRVTHRIVSVTGEGIVTKGDANRMSDGLSVTRENYEGRVIGQIPFAGFVCQAFFAGWWIPALILLLLCQTGQSR